MCITKLEVHIIYWIKTTSNSHSKTSQQHKRLEQFNWTTRMVMEIMVGLQDDAMCKGCEALKNHSSKWTYFSWAIAVGNLHWNCIEGQGSKWRRQRVMKEELGEQWRLTMESDEDKQWTLVNGKWWEGGGEATEGGKRETAKWRQTANWQQIPSHLASKIWRHSLLQLVGYDIMTMLDGWNLVM